MEGEEEDVWSVPSLTSGEGIVAGIDLGTSNSTIAFWHRDKMRVKVGERAPSLV